METTRGQDKMTAFLRTTFFQIHFLERKFPDFYSNFTESCYRFRWKFDTSQATNNYLNLWWFCLLTHIFVTFWSMSDNLLKSTQKHCDDVIMGAMASQITSLMIIYSTVYSDADQRKHKSSASLPFVQGIHRWPVNSPHKWPVTRKTFPFDDVIMRSATLHPADWRGTCLNFNVLKHHQYNIDTLQMLRDDIFIYGTSENNKYTKCVHPEFTI